MAKPTDEIIVLPEFLVPMVQKINDDMVETEISVKDRVE